MKEFVNVLRDMQHLALLKDLSVRNGINLHL